MQKEIRKGWVVAGARISLKSAFRASGSPIPLNSDTIYIYIYIYIL